MTFDDMTFRIATPRGLLLLLPLLLAGCARAVNPYAKWYETFPERAPTDSAVSPQEVWIMVGRNPRAEVPILLRNGYAVIGISQFNGPVSAVTDAQLRTQASKVGAQLVMQWARLSDIKGWPVDSTSPAQTRGRHVEPEVRANYGAMYFVRHADPMGLYLEDADDSTKTRLNAPHAMAVSLVVKDSPAAFAGIQPGDVIVGIAGAPIAADFDYRKFVESRRGWSTSFLLDRAGTAVHKVVIVRP
jgi:PDZ domain